MPYDSYDTANWNNEYVNINYDFNVRGLMTGEGAHVGVQGAAFK